MREQELRNTALQDTPDSVKWHAYFSYLFILGEIYTYPLYPQVLFLLWGHLRLQGVTTLYFYF